MPIVRIAMICLTAPLLLAASPPGAAQAPGTLAKQAERVPAPARLTPSESTGVAVVSGNIRGHAYRDFAVRAGAGQVLGISLDKSGSAAYFNVLPPGSSDVAMFIGSTSGDRFEGTAPIAGDYTVRVYLMRSAARRNETSRFTLTARLAGAALVPLPARDDAVVPGTAFHATATVRCGLPYQPDVHECEAGVIRYDHGGTATVELRGPRGFVRRILFVKGRPTATDAIEPPASTRSGDTTTVTIGMDERYEVPDALVTGG